MGTGFKWKSRYSVLLILFATWNIAYLDRMVMSVAIPYIAADLQLSSVEMGYIMSAFFAGYALLQIPGGMLSDKFGARKVMVVSLVWWSVFTFLTGWATTFAVMIVVRVAFGIGEGVFPASSWKSIANWFPKKERATATGIMLSSNALGPALAPLFVAGIIAAWGWHMVFYSLFIPGILTAVLIYYFIKDTPEENKSISPEELLEIQADNKLEGAAVPEKIGIMAVMKIPVVVKCFLIWLTFDITLWGFMSWLPTYLVKARGLEIMKMGIAASLPFFAGTAGLIFGGWISDKAFKSSRKTPIIISQILGAIFLYLTYTESSENLAILYQTLAGGFLFMAMGAFWALPMSTIPKAIMGTASGTINMAGQIAGFISPIVIGYLLQASGGNFDSTFIFLIIGTVLSCLITMTVKETPIG